VTLRAALLDGERLLADGGVAAPRLTAEVLLAFTLRRERPYLYAHSEQQLSPQIRAAFERCLRERSAGKPTQYITGVQEFYGREFRVTPAVMIPRPETEFVIEAVLVRGREARRVADVGCVSGAIAVTLRLELGVKTIATDISGGAIAVASANARRLGADVAFLHCNLLAAIADHSVDFVVSNPPYVPQTDEPALQREVRDHEPRLALYGGPDGLDFYQRLVAESPRVLRPGGWLIVEFGIRQRDPVLAMLDERWREIAVVDDLAGLPRVLAARYCP